jgi:CO/xanthine dehydrogenase FAD-binding subunit
LQRRQDLAAPVRLVSVAGVAGMQHCGPAEDGSYSIGGAVTLARLIAEAGPDLPLLGEAAATIASPQIRTAATIAGNLVQAKRCWFFRNGFECYKRSGPTCPCYAVLGDHRFHHAALGAHRCQAVTPSDLATVLTALDASVEFAAADGTGRVPIADFYTGPGETILRPGDLITAVVVPAAAAVRRGAFEKLRLWEGDFAVASAAVAADVAPDGRWRDVRIVLGAVAPEPWRALGAERALDGTRVGAAAAVAAVERDLWRAGHPLAGNRWKLGAAAGLVGHAVRRMTGEAP